MALESMGASPGIVEAMVVGSLGQAMRAASFPVPGAFGVQEGGFLLLGKAYGFPQSSPLRSRCSSGYPTLCWAFCGSFSGIS
ncbi:MULTISPECIES: hypothetical protein [Paraburkholderia]|uniref:Uncharacterized protein n=1 Tax=Paraburkholderia unamae TaxID=219649 RepID=A0ACC6RF90_9BURK